MRKLDSIMCLYRKLISNIVLSCLVVVAVVPIAYAGCGNSTCTCIVNDSNQCVSEQAAYYNCAASEDYDCCRKYKCNCHFNSGLCVGDSNPAAPSCQGCQDENWSL